MQSMSKFYGEQVNTYVPPDRLVVPLYSGERSASISYSVAAPKLWNSLPANIRNSKSLDTFKKHLKTHYLKKNIFMDYKFV